MTTKKTDRSYSLFVLNVSNFLLSKNGDPSEHFFQRKNAPNSCLDLKSRCPHEISESEMVCRDWIRHGLHEIGSAFRETFFLFSACWLLRALGRYLTAQIMPETWKAGAVVPNSTRPLYPSFEAGGFPKRRNARVMDNSWRGPPPFTLCAQSLPLSTQDDPSST